MLGYVIGDSDMITGFRLVGVEGVEVTSVDEAEQALKKALERSDVVIIIISEEFSTQPQLHETIDKVRLEHEFSTQPQLHETIDRVRRERRNPLIVELPGSRGKPSEARMSDLISKTLGIRL